MPPRSVRRYLLFALAWSLAVALWASLPSLLIASHAPAGAYYAGGVQNTEDACFYISQLADGAEGAWLLANRMSGESAGAGEFRPFFTLAGLLGKLVGLSPTATYRALNVIGAFLAALALSLLSGWMLGWSRAAMAASVLILLSAGPVALLPAGWRDVLAGTYGILPAEEIISESNTYRALAATGGHFAFSLLFQVIVFWTWARAIGGSRRTLIGLVASVFALGTTHPYDLPPLALAALLALLLPAAEARAWRLSCLVVLFACVPVIGYRAWLLVDPAAGSQYPEVFLNSPNPYTYLLALMPYCLLVPWAARGVPASQRLGARILSCWMAAVVACLYLPISIQRRMVEGLHWMAGLCGMAGAAHLWSRRAEWRRDARPWCIAALCAVLVVLGLVPNLRFPFAIAGWAASRPEEYFLSRPERSALAYCGRNLPPGSVIASSRALGPYVAARTPHRAFVAHYHLTHQLRDKLEALETILHPATLPLERKHLLLRENVTHLIFGPREAAMTPWRPGGDPALSEVYATPDGAVRVYAVVREE
ncbi:hypothetical protein HS125_06020 [bacterium]|nr:hypothetical protein [bacterium]